DPGLSAEQARALREVHGYNLIPPPTSLPPWLCCLIPCLRQSKARRYYDICVPDDCSVRREGRWLTIDALGVVVGDTVRLLPGHRAAADIRLLQQGSDTCMLDGYAITGNSEKIPYRSQSTEVVSGRPGLVPAGALCVQGSCSGVVIAVGARTLLGEMIATRSWPP
ncbi:unnamed protein product, partial [Ectocarpus fasciculatus]